MLFDKQSLITCIIDYLHCVEKFRPLVHSPILSWKFSVRSCLKENVQFYTKIADVKKVSWGPASLTLFFRTKGGQLGFRVNDVTFLDQRRTVAGSFLPASSLQTTSSKMLQMQPYFQTKKRGLICLDSLLSNKRMYAQNCCHVTTQNACEKFKNPMKKVQHGQTKLLEGPTI